VFLCLLQRLGWCFNLIIPIIAGLVSGIITGMGIGGGSILIPVLIFIIKVEQHTAQSINLVYFIPTAIIALIIHIKNKSVNFHIALSIIITGVLGAIIGSLIATSISSDILKKMFGVFLFFMGIHELIRK
jgi:uncharacterized membrane protein YfcA